MRQIFFCLVFLFFSRAGGGTVQADNFCEAEQQRAYSAKQQILSEWPIRGSADPITEYVQSLGFFLAQRTSKGTKVQWQFSVVRNHDFNAFSIGGGQIFVTEGVVEQARDESEIAAVLAHELSHELAGHFCDEPASNSFIDYLLKGDGKPEVSHSQVEVGSMRQTIDPVKEYQADQIAIRILQAGGYDVRSMLKVIQRLHSSGVVTQNKDQRIRNIQQEIMNMPLVTNENSKGFFEVKRIIAAENKR